MFIEKNMAITLNNNKKYFVANTINYNNEMYIFLINFEEDGDYFIAKQKGKSKLIRVNNLSNIRNLIKEYL